MKATRPGIVIGLVLALLVPGSVVGQEESSSALSEVTVEDPPTEEMPLELPLTDAVGDITDMATGVPVSGPGFGDVIALNAGVDEFRELHLWFNAQMAEPVLDAGDTDASATYSFMIDTDADGQADYTVHVASAGGWTAALTDVANGTTGPSDISTKVGDPVADRAFVSLPLSELGDPSDVRVQVVLRSSWPTDEGSNVEGLDVVPDDAWVVVTLPVPAAAAPNAKTAKQLINRKHPKVTLAAFEKAYLKMMKDPAAAAATPWTAAESRGYFKRCRKDPVAREAGMFTVCLDMLRSVIWAHTATGSADSWAAAKKGYDYLYNTSKRYRKTLNETVRAVFAEPFR